MSTGETEQVGPLRWETSDSSKGDEDPLTGHNPTARQLKKHQTKVKIIAKKPK